MKASKIWNSQIDTLHASFSYFCVLTSLKFLLLYLILYIYFLVFKLTRKKKKNECTALNFYGSSNPNYRITKSTKCLMS